MGLRLLTEIDADMNALRAEKEDIMAQLRVLAKERNVVAEIVEREAETARIAAGRGLTVVGG